MYAAHVKIRLVVTKEHLEIIILYVQFIYATGTTVITSIVSFAVTYMFVGVITHEFEALVDNSMILLLSKPPATIEACSTIILHPKQCKYTHISSLVLRAKQFLTLFWNERDVISL